ncbi:MAG: peptide ABC transporter substrate-binding protein [Clostridiales bacterium]|jgi:peptide/nickel transport system substrate-binding protein|nr:peptide ABC transporter substrate-binding protein [Clostridiales bacterium]
MKKPSQRSPQRSPRAIAVAAAALLTAALLPSGCLNIIDPEQDPTPPPAILTPSPEPTEAPQPRSGGTLRIPMRPPQTLNPLLNEDATVDAVLKLLFEPMMTLDTSLKPIGNLANFTFSADGMSVSVVLRDGLKWSDGVSVTTKDVAFSLNTLRAAPETSIYKSCAANISPQYVITDAQTIKIQFRQPFSGAAYQFCFPLIPEHYYQGNANGTGMKPVGNGLYVFDSYTEQREMRLNFNPDSYRKKPYIPSIEVFITPDQETEFSAFDQRLVDVISAEAADWGRYRNSREININEYVTNYYDFLGFNFNNGDLQDRLIRQAVAHAVDAEEWITSVYLGHAERAVSPLNPASWLYDPNVTQYEYSLTKAGDLLKQAGFSGGSEGKTLSLRLLANAENTERVKIANLLAESLTSLGVNAEADIQPFETYSAKIESKDFDIFVGGLNLSVIPDLTFAFGSGNLFSYHDDVMDLLLSNAFSAVSPAGHQKAMSDLQQKIAEDLPCVSLAFRKSAVLCDQKVQGPKKPVLNNILANINEWYIAVP